MISVIKSMRKCVGKRRLAHRFRESGVDASAARSGTTDPATGAWYRPRARLVENGWGVVYEGTERFPHCKPGHLFGRNLHRLTRFRVAAYARRPVAEPETSKAPQFHFVPSTESVGDALQEQIDDRGRLVW